ncbi:beta-N-acetylhexosaminidase [Spirosoma montaniterrae]|uniref:beta-N-acetylhexosaminidase n=1 Tax=Spirosoma montaniterrae TaxID=1178516 RepID=A0A1P9WTG3_9BACT|nr:family 20 glycosylhydrolase [Spirosoma montaniterrae]AQG78648.1 beta-N-acetylhexosaminidase [Spirosoma montaniterrae]
MKKLVYLLWLAAPAWAQSPSTTIPALIPAPQTLEPRSGSFAITNQTRLHILTPVASIRRMVRANLPGLKLTDQPRPLKAITVRLAPVPGVGAEGYDLTVGADGILLTAPQEAGLFYGLQTLRQLLPVTTRSGSRLDRIPALHIRDQPRFGWRGLMLDVSRHFFDKAFVKRFIDQMAQYKYNVFHWHLTDDQGWRIEIKSLPRLTQVGAFRVPRTGRWNDIENPMPGENPSYGGFYTQNDIREIVQYAAERQITIVPEIDMPGHSMAAIVAYPNLACDGKQKVVPTNGKFYKLEDNTLNPCSDSTYAFVDKVLTEVAALFPGPYIHVGGDEAYKGFWTTCELCKPVMATNGLKTMEELQSYFIRRVERIVRSKGKKLIGWDEILEGDGPTIRLAPGATVMSWRGMRGGIEAARQGRPVIMTPFQHCYLDLYQGEPSVEPSTYSMCRLSDSYRFEPVPDSVRAELILGGQGNLWTESVPTPRHAEYMVWPRAFALAEVLWSPKERRNWPEFMNRVEAHFRRFDALGINYARSVYNPIITVKRPPLGFVEVFLNHELPDVLLYYTTDSTQPDDRSLLYANLILMPKGASRLKVMAYRYGKPIGMLIDLPIEELARRIR